MVCKEEYFARFNFYQLNYYKYNINFLLIEKSINWKAGFYFKREERATLIF